MKTSEIAARLVDYCRRGDYSGAQRDLYSDDVVSLEPDSTPETAARGRAALAEKTKMWEENFEVHGGSVGDPIVSDPYFACTMSVDVTEKKSKQRMQLSELCVYHVKDGKIDREQFFMQPNGG